MFYFQCYLIQPRKFEIIQTSLAEFKPELILEKQPIYLEDSVVNPADLFQTVFKYLYIKHVLSISDQNLLKRNLSKFVMIYNDNDTNSINVKIIHPSIKPYVSTKSMYLYSKNYNVCTNNLLDESFVDQLANKDVKIVDVILKPNRCLILPINWYYQTYTDEAIEIHFPRS